MRRAATTSAVVLLACLASPALAGQAAQTEIDIGSYGSNCSDAGCDADITVTVTSEKKRCVDDRKVKFYARYPNERVKFDSDRTRDGGLAFGYGEVRSAPEGFFIKVGGEEVGATKCKRATLVGP